MFFGATAALESALRRRSRSASTEKTECVVLRVKRARNPDAVGITHPRGFLDRMAARGSACCCCGVRAEFMDKLERTGLAARLARADLPRAAGAPHGDAARDPPRLRAARRSLRDLPAPRRGQPGKSLYYAI
jgi:hypothetical protein